MPLPLTVKSQFLRPKMCDCSHRSVALEMSITHIWYSIHTSPCCTSFNSLSQVPFTVSHEVPPAGQFLSVGSLSLSFGLVFHENNCQYVNRKHSEALWTHSVTPLTLHNSALCHTTTMCTLPLASEKRPLQEDLLKKNKNKHEFNWICITFPHNNTKKKLFLLVLLWGNTQK